LSIRLDPPGVPSAAFVVVGLDQSDADALARGVSPPDLWPRVFRVTTAANDPRDQQALPPLLGKYGVEGSSLRFQPRFPLEPGVRYRASFDRSSLSAATSPAVSAPIVAEFVLPREAGTPTTRVSAAYPSRDTLPENLLKFYLQFTAPMSRGAAYGKVRLRDASGEALDLPFLELAEELWDPGGTRLTLLFDPGRIKTGLKPRDELGPVLVRGKSYTLEVDRSWPDAGGQPLASDFRKTFRVVEPDETPPDPSSWTMHRPNSGTRDALVLSFPEPLDRAMLSRVIAVHDDAGNPVPGEISIDREETRWRFTPDRPWRPGDYRVAVSKDLEDLAGNSIGRPFEVDVFDKVERKTTAEVVNLPFSITPVSR